jgi:hypothetical protein
MGFILLAEILQGIYDTDALALLFRERLPNLQAQLSDSGVRIDRAEYDLPVAFRILGKKDLLHQSPKLLVRKPLRIPIHGMNIRGAFRPLGPILDPFLRQNCPQEIGVCTHRPSPLFRGNDASTGAPR